MVFNVISREADVTTLDTLTPLTEQGANSPGDITVPVASHITEIRVGIGADLTADTLEGCTVCLKVSGNGLNAPDSYIGVAACQFAGAAATSATTLLTNPIIIPCKIPVIPGNKIALDGVFHGEDVGSLRIMATLVFDGDVVGTVKYFDYREADLAAANTPVTLANRAGKTENDFKVGSGQIVEVRVGCGNKPVAGPLAATTLFTFSGLGLAMKQELELQGNSISTQDDSAISGAAHIIPLALYKGKIPTKPGEIRVQAQEIEDDVGTPFAVCCLGFA